MVRFKRDKFIANPYPLLGKMRALRDEICRHKAKLEICGATYIILGGVLDAIDAAAEILVGKRDYFYEVGGGATDAERAHAVRIAQLERGEITPGGDTVSGK